MGAPHAGQREPGRTRDWPRGRRWMQTFAKLPTIEPKRSACTSKKVISGCIVAFARRLLHKRPCPGARAAL